MAEHSVHEQLAQMSRSIAQMGTAFAQMSVKANEAVQQINRDLSRMQGQTAARLDLQTTLWPGWAQGGEVVKWSGEPYCTDCPDREACMENYPCEVVRAVAADQDEIGGAGVAE